MLGGGGISKSVGGGSKQKCWGGVSKSVGGGGSKQKC